MTAIWLTIVATALIAGMMIGAWINSHYGTRAPDPWRE